MIVKLAFFASIVFLATSVSADDNVRIEALAVAHRNHTSTDVLRISRRGEGQLRQFVVPMKSGTLQTGDEIVSPQKDLLMRLNCRGAQLDFANAFDVLIEPPGDARCAVALQSGSIDVRSDKPVKVRNGGVDLGNESTEYRVMPLHGGVRILVYEGRVRVTRPDAKKDAAIQAKATAADRRVEMQKAVEIDRSRKYSQIPSNIDTVDEGREVFIAEDGISELKAIDAAELKATASVAAELDVAKALAAGIKIDGPKVFAKLQTQHLQVLEKPHDASLRTLLATEQAHLNLQSEVAYNAQTRLVGTKTQQNLLIYLKDAKSICKEAFARWERGDKEAARDYAAVALQKQPTDGSLGESERVRCQSIAANK